MHMPGPLKTDQLIEITGYKSAAKQVEWVRKHLGIEPPLRRDGRPSISQEVIDAATLKRRAGMPAPATDDQAPALALTSTSSTNSPRWRVSA
jgi:Domain of unknown function (DUF4224)